MRLLAAAFLAGLVFADEPETHSEAPEVEDPAATETAVLTLGAENFESVIKAQPFTLVEFYAPWCGHCKSLEPEYEQAAFALADNADIKLAKVDATEEKDLAEKYGVQGFPTIKWFVGSDLEDPKDYGGGRTASEIVAWINKQTGPPAFHLESVEALTKFQEDNEVCVVSFGEASDDFLSAAKASDEPFGVVMPAAVIEAAGRKPGDVVLFKHFDDKEVTLGADQSIVDLIKNNNMPLVSEFSEETAPKIFGGDVKKHILLFSAKSGEDHATIHAAFSESAAEFKGKVLFVYLDCDVEENEQVMEFFGITKDNCPVARIITMEEGMHKFAQDSVDNTATGFTAFANGVLDGTIKRHLMSEEIPEDNTAPVTILVGKNWDSVVADNEGAVFVEFYAPWCGHCQKLAPEWETVGEHFKDDDMVTIAKSDSTANEFDGVEVEGFPTLKFWPKGKGSEMMDYNGARTAEAMIKFVASNGEEVVEAEEEEEEEGDWDEGEEGEDGEWDPEDEDGEWDPEDEDFDFGDLEDPEDDDIPDHTEL